MAENGALPSWMGVVALSSKTVLVKLAALRAAPHAAEQRHRAQQVPVRVVMAERRRQVGVGGEAHVELDLHDAQAGRRLVPRDDEAVGHGDARGHAARDGLAR